jgi:OOP family OmpA-OmpF porin
LGGHAQQLKTLTFCTKSGTMITVNSLSLPIAQILHWQPAPNFPTSKTIIMKRQHTLLTLILTLISTTVFSQDAEGCKEHPMFPNRMSNYLLADCKTNFDAVDFNLAAGGSKMITKEGTKTTLRYDFNAESGLAKPSCLQILRNYESAAKKIGGVTAFFNVGEVTAVFKLLKNGREAAWVKIETGGNDNNDFYVLTIVELEAMKQEITSDDILTALNTDGRISLYINFATGKSDIEPDSQKIIDQISGMLSANPSLKVSVEGHTDNTGTPAGNKALSESRAKAVMNACITKGIDKSRLTAKGWGQDKPVADNATEEGKAQNRRVEIVKM